jgi:putative intracellular protease/amidase
MTKRILVVATNVAKYAGSELPTGLWLGELTHFWDIALMNKCTLQIASPRGGAVPLDPESMGLLVRDASTKAHAADPEFMGKLASSHPIAAMDATEFDAIYLTGGHGTMFDFVGSPQLNTLVQRFYESGKVVAAVCHGCCGLLDVQLASGAYLISGKRVTGYSWFEEAVARRKSAVPFNLEQRMRERGALYHKALLPLVPHTQEDGLLLTGQNPFSTKSLARLVMTKLGIGNRS